MASRNKQLTQQVKPLPNACTDALLNDIHQYTPLIRSVCRQALPHDFDLEDAVQETCIKLLHHHQHIHSNISAWLSMTARNVCADQMRRHINERNRIERWSRMPAAQPDDQHAQNPEQLLVVLGQLNQADRQLIIDRFLNHKPLRVLAGQRKVSVATMSRHIKQSLQELNTIYQDQLKHARHTGSSNANRVRDGSLLKQATNPCLIQHSQNDRLRVGFFLGWSSTLVRTHQGFRPPLVRQLRNTTGIANPNWEMIGLVEPDTWQYGLIESTLRDYEMLDGMIDASNIDELRTLDAIFMGDTFAMLPRVMEALIQAICDGVGLYSEAWTGVVMPGFKDKRVLQLMLADEAAVYHTPKAHDLPTQATVHATHACIPGIKRNCKLTVGGCGPVCQPARDATILITMDHMVTPTHQAKPDMTPGVRPVLSVGNIGKGRVVNMYQNVPWAIAHQTDLKGNYFTNMINWVAKRDTVNHAQERSTQP